MDKLLHRPVTNRQASRRWKMRHTVEGNVKDAQALAKLSEELRDSLEKSSSSVLSVADLKKADDIEKLH